MFVPQPPLPPPRTPEELEADDLRIRRSNLGGDDLITKVVFVVIVLALIAWVVHAWLTGHTTTAPH
jgi:hypothetical protein